MSSSNGNVFSETLQDITNTKLEELSKRRSDYETTKSNVLSMLEGEKDPSQRLYILSQGVKACYAFKLGKYTKVHNTVLSRNSELEIELKNLDCFLAQAKFDPSVSIKMMQTWEESLLHHLNTQSLKYQYASLYGQLVTEWLSTEKSKDGDSIDIAMTEGFEDVANTMKQDQRQQWERIVFEPGRVDEDKLRSYLGQLFSMHEKDASEKLKALNQFKSKVLAFENQMSLPDQFNLTTLKWVADGLLSSGLLSDEKREVLRDFKSNPIILGEVADVLNMRLAALNSWSWGSSVALEQRRQITGGYNVLMHEDLLQSIFLHYIGVKWSVFLKKAFGQFRTAPGAWETFCKRIPTIDAKRRAYYLGPEEGRKGSVQFLRNRIYREHYFMAQLMDCETQRSQIDDGEVEAEYQAASMMQQQPISSQAMPQQNYHLTQLKKMRAMNQNGGATRFGRPPQSDEDTDYEDTDNEDTTGSTNKKPMQSKQRLLRLLSTEIAINTKLYGEVTAFHSTFERWNTLLPHETILTVMSFFGVSETWLNFFKKFLKAPLRFLDDDPSTPPRNRSRGTPASYALSDVFGESILFCLDFAVNQNTGGAMPFRMQGDLWFWSRDHSAAVTAWKSVTDFVNATGTYINLAKSGTMRISQDSTVSLEIDRSLPVGDIRWGFLKLSSQTGKFEIDQKMVDKHIIDLRKQLQDKRNSVISFIQAWNTYAASFFTSNFGNAANCFGQDHVAQMLATHERIQREVFSSSSSLTSGTGNKPTATNIVDYLKNLMQERFGIADIPDAYLFFPIELGGLDLKSPLISTLQVHDTVLQDSAKKLDSFLQDEKDAYNSLKREFHTPSASRFCEKPAPNWEPEDKADRDRFMSFSEFTRYREDVLNYNFVGDSLRDVYQELLMVPKEKGIQNANARVLNGLKSLAPHSNLRGIKRDWNSMEPYWKWVVQLYGPEVMDRFGGMNIVEPGLLPMGMVSIFRNKRVQWQG
ncbi:hypothetical protein F4781DRAFT_393552 [Annulohypoxylon bovei var. microspora]|nr:hypothetical protein F4781DRAFT_393552 [Annulohypoxylon bovei var. microspora]